MEFQGTSGKWCTEYRNGLFYIHKEKSKYHREYIGHMYPIGVSSDHKTLEGKANANLIAHSPQMLEMLNRLVSALEDVESTLAHHNLSVIGYHLNGNEEPIMNFFNQMDMKSIEDAKILIKNATTI